MSSQLDKIKLDLISNNCQVAIFNTNGSLLESCNTLFTIDAKRSVYEQFDFLKSLEELIPTLPLREKLAFGAVEWEEQVQGFFAISLERKDENTLQWVIQDNSHLKNDTLNIQQERNDATINEEVLTIQRKYLEM